LRVARALLHGLRALRELARPFRRLFRLRLRGLVAAGRLRNRNLLGEPLHVARDLLFLRAVVLARTIHHVLLRGADALAHTRVANAIRGFLQLTRGLAIGAARFRTHAVELVLQLAEAGTEPVLLFHEATQLIDVLRAGRILRLARDLTLHFTQLLRLAARLL